MGSTHEHSPLHALTCSLNPSSETPTLLVPTSSPISGDPALPPLTLLAPGVGPALPRDAAAAAGRGEGDADGDDDEPGL